MAVIDVGAPAIDRAGTGSLLYTQIEGSNPANDTGLITSVEMWLNTNGSNVEVATFIDEGSNVFSTRDFEAIGDVPAGSKQTFSSLNMNVQTGDYIGLYGTAGSIEWWDGLGGINIWYKTGDYIPCTSQTFTLYAPAIISLYGTGATAGVAGFSHGFIIG